MRAAVVEAARKEQAQSLARTRATSLLERLKASADIGALAASESLVVRETGAFRRSDATIPDLGEVTDLKVDAFSLTAEQPLAKKVYDLDGDSIVTVLKERLPVDEAAFAQQKEPLKMQYRERRKRAVVEDFVDHLKASSDIQIQPDFLASIDQGQHLPSRRRR